MNDNDDFNILLHLQCKLTILPDILELSTMKCQNYFMIFPKKGCSFLICNQENNMKQKSENL